MSKGRRVPFRLTVQSPSTPLPQSTVDLPPSSTQPVFPDNVKTSTVHLPDRRVQVRTTGPSDDRDSLLTTVPRTSSQRRVCRSPGRESGELRWTVHRRFWCQPRPGTQTKTNLRIKPSTDCRERVCPKGLEDSIYYRETHNVRQEWVSRIYTRLTYKYTR